jgi:hypothetical protein
MKLLLLRCPKCAHPLAPGQNDQVVQCPNCRGAVSISESGIRTQPARYVAPAVAEPPAWLPFWVYQGQVTIKERKTQGGRSAEQEARTFWANPRRLFVPAWESELAEARELAQRLLQEQPVLEAMDPPEGASFRPAVVTAEDARKLLELVIVSMEANRNDWMDSLDFDLKLESEVLYLFPGESKEDGWRLLIKNS